MNLENIKKSIRKISNIMTENKDYLIKLDQQNGDGDLGVSMSDGFSAVALYAETSELTDIGRLFMQLGSVFNEAAPSSLGTIISFGFMGMAKPLKGKEEISLLELADAMNAGLQKIMDKAGSKPGEKTILDALCPAVEALKDHCSDPDSAWKYAAAAAADGSESTKKMKSVHGRAAYYAEKSIGILDGGSVVGRLIFEALAQ